MQEPESDSGDLKMDKTGYVRVKDHEAVRDLNTSAILFTDERSYKQARLRRHVRDESTKKDRKISELDSALNRMNLMMNNLIDQVNKLKEEVHYGNTR